MLELFSAEYFRDLVSLIRNGGDVKSFIANIEATERAEFLQNDKSIVAVQQDIKRINNAIDDATAVVNEQNTRRELVKRLMTVVESCPADRVRHLKLFLSEYVREWRLDSRHAAQLDASPSGLINRIKNGARVRAWNDSLFEFLNWVDSNNMNDVLREYVMLTSGNDGVGYTDILRNIDLVCGRAKTVIDSQRKSLESMQKSLGQIIEMYDNDARPGNVGRRRHRRRDIDALIAHLQDMQALNPVEYINGIEHIDDNTPVMFNIATGAFAGTNASRDLSFSPHEKALNNILWMRGLSRGLNTDAWHVRAVAYDDNKLEMFSPLMRAADAREIVPILLNDLELVGLRRGLAMPIHGQDLPRRDDVDIPAVDGDYFARMVSIMELSKDIKRQPDGVSEAAHEHLVRRAKALGFDTLDAVRAAALPTMDGGDAVMQTYPPEKYIFSGSAVSDDYFPFSRRVGRSGFVYAALNAKYASGYSCAKTDGSSPTLDNYPKTAVGQMPDGRKICIGFLNVFARSENNKFYRNFGVEDTKDGNGETALTADQAMRDYYAETIVNRDENPLCAKLLHVALLNPPMISEFFVPMDALPTAVQQNLVQARRAKIENTYIGEPDIPRRLYAQRAEFDAGITHKTPVLTMPGRASNIPLGIAVINDIHKQNS